VSVLRPARRLARGVLILALAFTLMGSGCGSPPPDNITYNGAGYHGHAWAFVPEADLTPIGRATTLTSQVVSDPTVLAIRDIDPAQLVALNWDVTRWKASEDEPDPPNVNVSLFLADGVDGLPQAVCRYFDPRSASSTEACQDRLAVELDGVRYVPVEGLLDPTALKGGSDTYHFLPTDLTPIGDVADLDPRLRDESVGTMAHAIRGIDQGTAIVLIRDYRYLAPYLVFVREDATKVPFGLCPYVAFWAEPPPDASDKQPPNLTIPEGCVADPDDPARDVWETLQAQSERWQSRGVTEYEFSVELRCFCLPEFRGPFQVDVSDDHNGVSEVRLGDRVLGEDDRAGWRIGRAHDLFDFIRSYVRSDSIDVTYDATTGFPLEMRADPDEHAIDDEIGFVVTDFTVIR